MGDISLNPAARNAKLTQNSNSLGVGSQIKLADDFIVRVTYSQQQVDDFTNSQNRLQSDIIRFGTSINFNFMSANKEKKKQTLGEEITSKDLPSINVGDLIKKVAALFLECCRRLVQD